MLFERATVGPSQRMSAPLLSQRDGTHGIDDVVLGGCGKVRLDRIVACPATESHDNLRANAFFREQIIGPTAAEIVGRDALVVTIVSHIGGPFSSLFDLVEGSALRAVDEWPIAIEVLVLDVAVDIAFELDGEPGLPILTVDVFAGGVLPAADV